LAFFAQTIANFCKKIVITLIFEKKANFFAESWQKSQKIVIRTSTPEHFLTCQNERTYLWIAIVAGEMRSLFMSKLFSGKKNNPLPSRCADASFSLAILKVFGPIRSAAMRCVFPEKNSNFLNMSTTVTPIRRESGRFQFGPLLCRGETGRKLGVINADLRGFSCLLLIAFATCRFRAQSYKKFLHSPMYGIFRCICNGFKSFLVQEMRSRFNTSIHEITTVTHLCNNQEPILRSRVTTPAL
jgi:hypothetical protein